MSSFRSASSSSVPNVVLRYTCTDLHHDDNDFDSYNPAYLRSTSTTFVLDR